MSAGILGASGTDGVMKLYINPGACSLGPHIALHELDLPHEVVQVLIKKGETFTAEHLARNPLGMVPVLELDNGEFITECTAIFNYLSEQKPDMELFPSGYRFLELMSMITTELHKSFLPLFYGHQILKEHEAARGELAEFYKDRLKPRWQQMNDRLEGQDWLFQNRFSAADIYLYVVMNWWKFLGNTFEPWPNLAAFHQRMAQRQGVQKAHQHEKLPSPV